MSDVDNLCKESNYHTVFMQEAECLRNFLYYKSGDMQAAEDLVQDSFVKLWQNCSKVSLAKARSYLFTIANNLFLNTVARTKVKLKFDQSNTARAETRTPEYLLEEKEFSERLEAAISNLPEDQRTIFLMSRIDKKKYREIAEELGMSIKTVEKKMHLALMRLRKLHKKV